MLLQLYVVFAVTVIQLTSSQFTYDVDNDVTSSCESTHGVLSQLVTAVSQLTSAVSRLEAANTQLQRDVDELKLSE